MAMDIPGMLNPRTLPDGVLDPMEYRKYSTEKATVVPVYSDDADLGIVCWNLTAGQENESHMHPENAHCFLILEGRGVYTQGEPGSDDYREIPVEKGQVVMIPRGLVHGIRNTGSDNLSYFAITTMAGEYKRIIDGVDTPPH